MTFPTNFELLYLVDDIIDLGRPSRVPNTIDVGDCTVGHVVGKTLLVCLKRSRPTALGPVESWREDIVVGVVVGKKTEEPFDIRGSNRQQFITGESAVMDVVGSRVAAVWKLHEPGKLRMTAVLVRHVPAIVGLK